MEEIGLLVTKGIGVDDPHTCTICGRFANIMNEVRRRRVSNSWGTLAFVKVSFYMSFFNFETNNLVGEMERIAHG